MRPMADDQLTPSPVDDPDGTRWQRAADAEWARANKPRARKPYAAPTLPDFRVKAADHVTRDVLGRFLQDRDTGLVHDVYAATAECDVDAITSGTWYHFWHEVVADPANDVRCPHCLGAQADVD